MMEPYRIEGVPLLVVNGHYETAPYIVAADKEVAGAAEPQLFAATLKVMDWLVVKAAKEHKAVASEGATVVAAKSGNAAKK
jgi:thiol:disulfide interchange protein DsbA